MSDPTQTTYEQFTDITLQNGLLDRLLATVKLHVHEEFTQQRITGGDYARVYLGTMEAALTNSTQYLLGTVLLEQQKEKIAAEIELIELERDKLQYEIDYMYPAQLLKLQQEGQLIEAQVRLAEAEILKTTAEIAKIEAEVLMLETQKDLIAAQILKINEEIEFLDAKIKTELANTMENFTPGSVIGRQTTLLRAQQLGFAGDLEHKISKLHADYQSVWMSVEEPGTAESAVLQGKAKGEDAEGIADQIEALP